jgi:hypothetical protein
MHIKDYFTHSKNKVKRQTHVELKTKTNEDYKRNIKKTYNEYKNYSKTNHNK